MKKSWYCVTPRFVAAAETDATGRVRYGAGWLTAPILKKFDGQPIENLEQWLRSIQGSIKELPR